MTTFSDLKYFFHRLGGMFGWVGDLVRGWPWPLDYLAWPFDNIENVFYERDWLFDGLNVWINGIAADARNAWSYASSAYNTANSALSWINTTGATAYSYAVSAYNTANNAWNWISSTGSYLSSQISNVVSMINALYANLPAMVAIAFEELRPQLIAEIDALRITLEEADEKLRGDINWLKETVSPEAIKANLVDWLVAELDRLW